MNLLQQKIKQASQSYYSDGKSNVSDAEFDAMLEQLKKEDPNSPLLDVGHGYDVFADTTPGEKVAHRYGIVGSLDKCHNHAELDSRIKNKSLWASLKLDGLSVVLYYRCGVLHSALTRGRNGIGIDITPKASYILQSKELKKDKSFTGAVRGEILMSYENFYEFQKIHPDAENARNSAAGLINAKEITDELSLLNIVVYNVIGIEDVDDSQFKTYTSMRSWLIDNFEDVVEGCVMDESDLSESTLENTMHRIQESWYGTYPADGVVLSQDELILSLGKEAGQSIIYLASAFKFHAEQVTTTVLGVNWKLSKTRYMIPVVQLSPVQLAGTTVKAATGISAQYIKENNIGVGSSVTVEKANEIIPKILSVNNSGELILPTHCYKCGHELTWAGVHLQCPNESCSGGDLQDTLIWMSTISPCEGLGDTLKTSFLEELFGEDQVSIEKIYESNNPHVFIGTSSVQKKLFSDMYEKLFTSKVKLCDAIRALNIPRFGDVNSNKLAEYPKEVKLMLEAAISGDYQILDLSDKIGEANFKSLSENLRKLKRLSYIQDNIIWEPEIAANGKVAITGKLSVPRAIFESELKNAGFTPGGIGKDTRFLITNTPDSSTSKNQQADKFGIIKITEDEFRSKYMMNIRS